jgi:(2Fe-2S) ferredoxin
LRYLKKRLRESAFRQANGKVEVRQVKCLRRCREGPVLLLNPGQVWYTYHDEQDIDELVDEHVVRGCVVERLRLADGPRLTRSPGTGTGPRRTAWSNNPPQEEEPNNDQGPGAGRRGLRTDGAGRHSGRCRQFCGRLIRRGRKYLL